MAKVVVINTVMEDFSDDTWVIGPICPFGRKITVLEKLCLLPRRCHYSGKSIWLKRAVRVKQTYAVYDDHYSDSRWYDIQSYVFLKLRA